MKASIIAIGSEMLGRVRVDTNSLKVTAAFEDAGVELVRKSVVGDALDRIVAELDFALEQSDVLVLSGGLGPTEDDLTREALAKAFGLEMDVDESITAKIEARFAARGWKMPEVNKRQARVFRGQTTLQNDRGTAPGFHIVVREKDVWVFPGVPHELEWMIATYLRPWLQQRGGVSRLRRILKIAGMTESGVEERLKPYYDARPGEPLTILASGGQIELHVEAGDAAGVALREQELREIFGDRLFGFDDDSLESVIGRMLTERGETVATAESCTGGLVGSRITDVPGSSRYFMGGVVCYHARAKIDLAAVDPALIEAHGEVSQEVAVALATGVRARFGTTYGVGVTGIAGPGGGSEAKPVGTVYIAVATPAGNHHRKFFWQGPRTIVKSYSAQGALDLLRVVILRSAGLGPQASGLRG